MPVPPQLFDHLGPISFWVVVTIVLLKQLMDILTGIVAGTSLAARAARWLPAYVHRRHEAEQEKFAGAVRDVVVPMFDDLTKKVTRNGGDTTSVGDTAGRIEQGQQEVIRKLDSVAETTGKNTHRLDRLENWYKDMETREDRHELEHEQMERNVAGFVNWAGKQLPHAP